jgi:hypothetical protein
MPSPDQLPQQGLLPPQEMLSPPRDMVVDVLGVRIPVEMLDSLAF